MFLQIFTRIKEELSVKLESLKICTEVGSGKYQFTPIMFALCGAEVHVYTETSTYGSRQDIYARNKRISMALGVSDRIEYYSSIANLPIETADIVTNMNWLRPIDQNKLSRMKKDTIVPIMYESWELRPGEIDIGYAFENDIHVIGTDEHDTQYPIFEYFGPLTIKLVLEAGFSILDQKIHIVGQDQFSTIAKKYIKKLGGRLVSEDVAELIVVCDYYNSYTNDIDIPIIRVVENQRMTRDLSYVGWVPYIRLILGSVDAAAKLKEGLNQGMILDNALSKMEDTSLGTRFITNR